MVELFFSSAGPGFLIALIPALIVGWIAFHTTKRFGKPGYWVFGTIVAIGWGFVGAISAVDAGGFELFIVPMAVSAMLTISIGVWVGLAKASHSEVKPNEPHAIKSGPFKEEFIYREFRVFVKNDFYRYSAEKFETVDAAKTYIDSFMDGPK